LFVTQTCTAQGTVQLAFTWSGNNPAAMQQWFDMSLQNNGWLPGTFSGFGPMSPVTTSMTVPNASGNTVHFIRVNQQMSSGFWEPSVTFQLTTIDCSVAIVSAATPIIQTNFVIVQQTVIIQPVTTVVILPGARHAQR